MARSTGVSQPHLHNILKGIRALPPELADQLLALAGLNIVNLMGIKQFEEDAGIHTPLSEEAQINMSEIEKIIARLDGPPANFPSHQLDSDPPMEPRFHQGDFVYYEQGVEERTVVNGKSVYLVSLNDRLRVRYLRMGGQRLYLVSEDSLRDPVRWDYVSLADRHILEIVRGRIVWICRKVEDAETSATEEARRLDRRAS